MKKFSAVVIAAVLAASVGLMLTACGGNGESDIRFYAYDTVTGEYDVGDYLEISGSQCSMISKDPTNAYSLVGDIKYDGEKFVMTFPYEQNGKKCSVVLNGEKDGFGVLRIDSQTRTKGDKTETLDSVVYYCNRKCAPQGSQGGPAVVDSNVYYRFDSATMTHSEINYITVNGGKCIFTGDLATLGNVEADGTIAYTDDEFVIECSAQVGFATVRITLSGRKEKAGVLAVRSTAIMILGNTEVDTSGYYYCIKGATPDIDRYA